MKEIKFSIEDRDKDTVFLARQNGNKIYEADITGMEMDIFDCIQMFMDDHKSLFRDNRVADSRINSSKIKWTGGLA